MKRKYCFLAFVLWSSAALGDGMEKEIEYFEELDTLVPLATNQGGCLVTKRISVDGLDVGYMYRESGSNELDNGWRFFSGDETQEYVNDLSNTNVFDTNTIANHDPAILPYLDAPVGSAFERVEGRNEFRLIEEE